MTYTPFVKGDGTPLMIVGDSPSKKDVEHGRCFSGDGAVMLTNILLSMGKDFAKVDKATVLSTWPVRGDASSIFASNKTEEKSGRFVEHNGGWVKPGAKADADALWAWIEERRPKRILALGAIALWALVEKGSINAWRGSMLVVECSWGSVEVIPTYHPSALMRKKEWKIPFMRDLGRFYDLSASFAMPKITLHTERSFEFYRDYLQALKEDLDKKEQHLAVDLETRSGWITVCGIAVSKRECLVIPFTQVDKPNYFTVDEEVVIVKLMREVLMHKNARVSGQNFQYDTQYFAKVYGIYPHLWRDSMVEAHGLWTKNLELGLSFLASMFCEWYKYWKEDGKSLHTDIRLMSDQRTYWDYNGYDCCYTFEIVEELDKVWKTKENKRIMDMQRDMQNIVIKPSISGIRFDQELRAEFAMKTAKVIAQYRDWFERMIPNEGINKGGKSHWCDSPTRLSYFLYEQLGIEPVLDPKTKRPTSSGAALGVVGRREPMLARVMQRMDEYRSITQYFNLYLQCKLSDDGRVRTQYMLPGTDTFRLASKKDGFDEGLNLQNISKGKE